MRGNELDANRGAWRPGAIGDTRIAPDRLWAI